jgi:putative oxidoreductase
MSNSLLTRIGTWLYALVIAFFGINHFLNASAMGGMVPASIPGGVVWVYITGACLILAALAILSGKYTKLACMLLALLLVMFVLLIHLPHAMSDDPNMKMMGMPNLLKDLSMAAGALVIAGASNVPGDVKSGGG